MCTREPLREWRGSMPCIEGEEGSALPLAHVLAVGGQADAQTVLVETHVAHRGIERRGGIHFERGELAAVEAPYRQVLFVAGVHLVIALAVGARHDVKPTHFAK